MSYFHTVIGIITLAAIGYYVWRLAKGPQMAVNKYIQHHEMLDAVEKIEANWKRNNGSIDIEVFMFSELLFCKHYLDPLVYWMVEKELSIRYNLKTLPI